MASRLALAAACAAAAAAATAGQPRAAAGGAAQPRSANSGAAQAQNILFIIVDDLGHNDISFNGSPQIPTPNIDAIFQSGVALDGYHAQPVCSPSRASLLSGRHVIHTGVYMPLPTGSVNYRLNTSFSLLPQYLKRANEEMVTHMVGKWHLGQNSMSALPIRRGFDAQPAGYWTGAEDHVSHTVTLNKINALDFTGEDGVSPAPQYNGTFSTEVFTAHAVEFLQSFAPGGPNAGRPFFLYLAYQDVHWPLQAPQAYLDRFKNNTGGNAARQAVAAMAAHLDDGIGNVTAALRASGLAESTLIVFISDNGGPTNGNEGTESNNYPLRGGKNTIWEGGTRVCAAIAGAGVTAPAGSVSTAKMHVTDWLGTLVRAATGRNWTELIAPGEPPYQLGDGMDVWDAISSGAPSSPRDWLLLETHPPGAEDRVHGDALILGDWKLIKWNNTMPPEENGWWPPPGQDPSKVHYRVDCGSPIPSPKPVQHCNTEWCLFNVTADPCEIHNVAADHPDVVQQLVARLAEFSATAVPPLGPDGCNAVAVPLPGGGRAWQPCDAPGVLAAAAAAGASAAVA